MTEIKKIEETLQEHWDLCIEAQECEYKSNKYNELVQKINRLADIINSFDQDALREAQLNIVKRNKEEIQRVRELDLPDYECIKIIHNLRVQSATYKRGQF